MWNDIDGQTYYFNGNYPPTGSDNLTYEEIVYNRKSPVNAMLTGRQPLGTPASDGTYAFYYFCETNSSVAGYPKGAMVKNVTVNGYTYGSDGKCTTGFTAMPTYSTSNPTNGSVTATITANDVIRSLPSSEWTYSRADKKAMSITFTANESREVTIYDYTGRSCKVSISVANIDKTAPKVNVYYDPNTATNGDVTAMITSDEEMQETSGWQLAINKRSMTKTYSENASEKVTVKDLAGNSAQASVKVTNIDKTAPTPSINYSTQNLTNGDVIATISAGEVLQAIDGWTLSNNKKSMTKTYNENTNESVIISDLAGNTATVDVSISNIDKTEPRADITYSTKELTNGNVTATISAIEELKPLKGWTLSNDHKTLTKTYTMNTSEEVTIADLAGNTFKLNVIITNIDVSLPKITVTCTPTEKTKFGVIATIKADEKIKPIDGWEMQSDEKTAMKTFTSNTNTSVRVEDLAGNYAMVPVVINNIDTEPPIANVSYSTTQKTTGSVVATIKANEELQTTEGWLLSSDKKSLTKTYTTNVREDVDVYDELGNKTIVVVSISNIENNGLIVTVEYSTTVTTDSFVGVTITANKEIQAIDGWTLASDKQSLNKTFWENTEETIIVKDKSGNSKTLLISVKNIKKQEEPVVDPDNPDPGTDPTPTPADPVKGDVNGDNRVTATDLFIFKKKMVGLSSMSDEDKAKMDLNGDKKITVTDMLMLKKIIVGLAK